MVDEMVFEAAFGSEKRMVILSKTMGGGQSYQLSINKYHQGTFICYQGKWRAYLNDRSELTNDDIFILIEMIKGNEAPQ